MKKNFTATEVINAVVNEIKKFNGDTVAEIENFEVCAEKWCADVKVWYSTPDEDLTVDIDDVEVKITFWDEDENEYHYDFTDEEDNELNEKLDGLYFRSQFNAEGWRVA